MANPTTYAATWSGPGIATRGSTSVTRVIGITSDWGVGMMPPSVGLNVRTGAAKTWQGGAASRYSNGVVNVGVRFYVPVNTSGSGGSSTRPTTGVLWPRYARVKVP